ncbi:MAG: hypothetical protein WCG48_00140 [Candidatus Berkelbacteria bacterium]
MAKNVKKVQDPRRSMHVQTMVGGVIIFVFGLMMIFVDRSIVNNSVLWGIVALAVGVLLFEVGRRKLN